MNRIAALFLLLGLVAGVCAREYRVDRTRDIVYKEIDGKKLKLNVFVPKGDGPFPAVLVVHGGAWRAGSRTQLTMYAKSLARRGFSCFAINYRLAPKHKSPAQIEDCRDAVRWIRRNAADYRTDPGRIGAIGYSAGGHLVSLLAQLRGGAPDVETLRQGVQIAIDAVQAARDAHHFLSVTKQGISAIVSTSGNDCCHVILRGSSRGTNYDRESVQGLAGSLAEAGVHRRVMVDCSHGNSRKDHRRQSAVARDVGDQLAAGSSDIFGVMLESHLVEGRQDLVEGEASMYGQSVTDACISWEATETVLAELAEAIERRRRA